MSVRPSVGRSVNILKNDKDINKSLFFIKFEPIIEIVRGVPEL